jgi:hypothetical protein
VKASLSKILLFHGTLFFATLISNQAVSNEVASAFRVLAKPSSRTSHFRTAVLKATGLKLQDVRAFSRQLDLTSHTGSRFELEDKLLLEIATWTGDDARAAHENLLNYIRKQMLTSCCTAVGDSTASSHQN